MREISATRVSRLVRQDRLLGLIYGPRDLQFFYFAPNPRLVSGQPLIPRASDCQAGLGVHRRLSLVICHWIFGGNAERFGIVPMTNDKRQMTKNKQRIS
jgi:hypothetical protein